MNDKGSGTVFHIYNTASKSLHDQSMHTKTVGLLASDVHTMASVAYQVILEPGIGQFCEFKARRAHSRHNPLGILLVHKLTRGKRESVS